MASFTWYTRKGFHLTQSIGFQKFPEASEPEPSYLPSPASVGYETLQEAASLIIQIPGTYITLECGIDEGGENSSHQDTGHLGRGSNSSAAELCGPKQASALL